MKAFVKNTTLILFFLALIAACSQKNTEATAHKKSAIQPPLKGIEVPTTSFQFQANEDQLIRTKEGTNIRIPANSLVDEKGRTVKGKVELNYRSINTPGEIIASGIPMRYDSSGVKYDFVSAGMFEISAQQKGKELFVAKGKKLNVDFASYKNDGEDYSFYKINPQTGTWTYEGTTTPTKNEQKVQKLQKFEDDNLIVLDIDYSTHEELKPFHNLKWLCIDPNEKDNPIKNDWIAQERWFEISLNVVDKDKGIYEIYLSNGMKSAKFKVSPYEMDKDFVNNQIAQLNETTRLKKEEEERIQFEADIYRSFEIASFGTYNWDRIEKEVNAGNLVVTNATFNVNSQALDSEVNVYHFSGKDKLLSRVDNKWEKLLYNPNEPNKFLIVLPNNYVAISKPQDFEQAKNKSDFLFQLSKQSKKIKSIKELDELLKSS